MMKLVFDRAHVLAWASSRLPSIDMERAQAIGVADPKTGEIIAVAVFHNFRGHDVEIGFAADSPRWAQRGVVRAIFDYVFNQLGCDRLTTITAETNVRARRLDEGLGFVFEGRHPNGMAPGVAAISYGMQRGDCKWI